MVRVGLRSGVGEPRAGRHRHLADSRWSRRRQGTGEVPPWMRRGVVRDAAAEPKRRDPSRRRRSLGSIGLTRQPTTRITNQQEERMKKQPEKVSMAAISKAQAPAVFAKLVAHAATYDQAWGLIRKAFTRKQRGKEREI